MVSQHHFRGRRAVGAEVRRVLLWVLPDPDLDPPWSDWHAVGQALAELAELVVELVALVVFAVLVFAVLLTGFGAAAYGLAAFGAAYGVPWPVTGVVITAVLLGALALIVWAVRRSGSGRG